MIKTITGGIILLLIAVSGLFGCTTARTTQPPSQATPIASIPSTERPLWEIEWEKTRMEARKEGVIVAYGPPVETTDGIRKAMEKFGVKYETITGRGAEVGQKLQTERKGGVFVADVFIGGSNTSLVINRAGALVYSSL